MMKLSRKSKGPTCDKSFVFSLRIIEVCKKLNSEREFVLSKQLLRSGTAIGALSREAQKAESTKDFIHKLAIALKEADETLYWIDLLYESDQIDELDYKNLYPKGEELVRLLTSSIVSAKTKLRA